MTPQQEIELLRIRARARARAAKPAGNPPPAGMTAQEAAERDMAAATEGVPARRAYEASPVAAGVASAIKGVPFVGEYADEATGVVFGEQAMERQRLATEGFERANPGLATGLQVATGIATGIPLAMAAAPAVAARVPASMLGKVATGLVGGATAGATEGAISGFGQEGDRVANAGTRAAVGAALGGAVGGAAPLVASGAANVARSLRARPDASAARALGASPESANVVGRMIDADGGAARISQSGGMVADAGPSTAGLLDSVARTPGPGQRIAQDAVEGRARAAAGEMKGALDDAMGPATLSTRMKYSPETKRLYDAAYSRAIDYSAGAGRDIEALLPRVPGSIIARANRLMQVSGEKTKQILADVAEDGAVTFREMPDTRQLDYITRALQDVGRAGDGQGALGGSTAEGRAFRGLAREIRMALKDANPVWRGAVDKAASEISIKHARELGADALKTSTSRGDLAEELMDMGASEKAALKRGVRSYVDDILAGVKRTAGAQNTEAREGLKALTELSSRANRQKLTMILGNTDAKALFRRLDEAGRAFELRARVAEGSQTAGRLAFKDTIDRLTSQNAVQELLSGSPVASARKLVQSMTGMTDQAKQEVADRIGREVATLLTGPRGPDAQRTAAELVRLLQRQPATEALARQIGQAVATSAAVGGYQSGQQSLSR